MHSYFLAAVLSRGTKRKKLPLNCEAIMNAIMKQNMNE
jgi:hypothetical protein